MASRGHFVLVQNLMEKGHTKLAYDLIRKDYEQSLWKGESAQWQIEALMTIAQLSIAIGQKGKCSIPYIDEALILVRELDTQTYQVYEDKLQALRRDYIGMK